MKHVVLNIFTIIKLAKCKQFQLVLLKHTNMTNKTTLINNRPGQIQKQKSINI